MDLSIDCMHRQALGNRFRAPLQNSDRKTDKRGESYFQLNTNSFCGRHSRPVDDNEVARSTLLHKRNAPVASTNYGKLFAMTRMIELRVIRFQFRGHDHY